MLAITEETETMRLERLIDKRIVVALKSTGRAYRLEISGSSKMKIFLDDHFVGSCSVTRKNSDRVAPVLNMVKTIERKARELGAK